MAWRAREGDLPSWPEDDIEPMQYVWVKARMEALHYELLMRALNKIRHELGDPDLSFSQLILMLAERELERIEDDKARKAQEESGEPPCECHHHRRGENAWSSNYRVIEKLCPACHRAWMETHAGPIEIERETREMIECDADVICGDEACGTPGHKRSGIPPATRRAVLARDDARCQVPGCGRDRWVDLHHIKKRSEGGSHDPLNLVTTCTLCGLLHKVHYVEPRIM